MTHTSQLLSHHDISVNTSIKLLLSGGTQKKKVFSGQVRGYAISRVITHKKRFALSTLQGFSLLTTGTRTWNPYYSIGIQWYENTITNVKLPWLTKKRIITNFLSSFHTKMIIYKNTCPYLKSVRQRPV